MKRFFVVLLVTTLCGTVYADADAKPESGGVLPTLTLPLVGGGEATLGGAREDGSWQLVVVYRGKHCPICVNYLGTLDQLAPKFHERKVQVVAVSGDPQAKAEAQKTDRGLEIPVAYGMTEPQMRSWGLYVSDPRSPEETDRPFPEPGLYLIRPDGRTQMVEVTNAPFVRPDLELILKGVGYIQDNDYPIRGTR